MLGYSPQKANDPGTRNGGYFFGSFFMISRDTYEAIGTHERVRAEIVEDVELGRMVKERGIDPKWCVVNTMSLLSGHEI